MVLPTLAIICLLPATSPRADWAFSGGPWGQPPDGVGPPQPRRPDAAAGLLLEAPPNVGVGPGDNLAFFTSAKFKAFTATFAFRFPVNGSSDYPGPAGFALGATNASAFLALEFPCIAPSWRSEVFWATLSRYRPDGWREGLATVRVAGVSSTPGLWHHVRVSMEHPGVGAGVGASSGTLRVWVDEVPLSPWVDGAPTEEPGRALELPELRAPGYLGLLSSNGQGALRKPVFYLPSPRWVTGTEVAPAAEWDPSIVAANPSTEPPGWMDGSRNSSISPVVRCNGTGPLVMLGCSWKNIPCDWVTSHDEGRTWQRRPAPANTPRGDGHLLRCSRDGSYQLFPSPGGNNGSGAAGHEDRSLRTLLLMTTPSLSANWSSPQVVHEIEFTPDLTLGRNGR